VRGRKGKLPRQSGSRTHRSETLKTSMRQWKISNGLIHLLGRVCHLSLALSFCSTGVWTDGLTLAKQTLLPLDLLYLSLFVKGFSRKGLMAHDKSESTQGERNMRSQRAPTPLLEKPVPNIPCR
jgi:hypothetical protein